ncbi:MAG: PAS domain-containing protein [Deltaproteobacteria bacterium]|nr:PAS domain-containing protein [Deltaproteobacteria bacterium]
MVFTSLLAFYIFFKLKFHTPEYSSELISIYFLLALTYLVTFFYVLGIRRVENITLFASSQTVYDILFVTTLIYVLKTPDSIFNILYSVIIFFSSLLFQRGGAWLTACLCTISFSLYLTYNPIVDSERHLYVLFINNFIFFLVAYATGTLSEQLKMTGMRLKEKESFTQTVIHNLTNGLIVSDQSEHIIFMNPAAESIFSKTKSELLHKKISEVLPSLELDQKSQDTEYLVNDEKKVLEIFQSVFKDAEGKEIGKILIVQDRTQIKCLEEKIRMSDKLAAVGKLAAGIAHEIRNPLASVSGSLQLLKKSAHVDEDDKKLMNIMLKETERLNTLITELLAFVRPAEIRPTRIKIKEFIEEMFSAFRQHPLYQKKIQLHHEGKEDVFFYIDGEKFKQILWNILINSAQAIEDEGDIFIEWEDKDSVQLLTIRDTGGGINTEIKEKIFDPFFTTKEGGTGLGLATTYKIIEAHGGDIAVESESGKGTSFILSLPKRGGVNG